MRKPRILFLDDQIAKHQPQVEAACPSFDVIASDDPLRALEQFRFSEVQPDLVLLDVNFHTMAAKVAKDFPGQEAHLLGVHLLEHFRAMDADIPVAILTAFGNLQVAFGAGHHRANAFYTKEESFEEGSVLDTKLRALLDETRYSYDRAQQQLAEEVADKYRELEASSPGTVAYWHFEEQTLIDTVKRIDKPEVHVLDIGVGDGRYPAVLFREFPGRVRVTGVDFSGNMLAQSRQRLQAQYDAKDFRVERGAAERLALADSSYDLIIAGFGFLSYSGAARVLETIRRVARPVTGRAI